MDSTSNNTAKAADECELICASVLAYSDRIRRCRAIIQAACEEAYRNGWKIGRDFAVEGQRNTATATVAQQGAAHASETAEHSGRTREIGCPECEAAHASEHHQIWCAKRNGASCDCGGSNYYHASQRPTPATENIREAVSNANDFATLEENQPDPTPTGKEWTLVPVTLDGYVHHFNVMQGTELIYEGVTSEHYGNHLVSRHNATLQQDESFGLCLSHRAAYRLAKPEKCPICRLLEENAQSNDTKRT